MAVFAAWEPTVSQAMMTESPPTEKSIPVGKRGPKCLADPGQRDVQDARKRLAGLRE